MKANYSTSVINITDYKIMAYKYINNIELYGGGAILERIAAALAQTRLRFNRP